MSRVAQVAAALLIMLLTTPVVRAADSELKLKPTPAPSPAPDPDIQDGDLEIIQEEAQNATAEDDGWINPPGDEPEEEDDRIVRQAAHVIVERALRFASLVEKKVGKNWMGPTRKYLDSQLGADETKPMCKKELVRQMLRQLSNSTESDAKQAGPISESLRETYRATLDCAEKKKE